MDAKFIRASFDLHCEWEGLPPVYRIYVNDELFSERTWTWTDAHLREVLQIKAPPGKYRVQLEQVGPQIAKFHMSNYEIEYGPGRWVKGEYIGISDES